jgi:hypothetical protein
LDFFDVLVGFGHCFSSLLLVVGGFHCVLAVHVAISVIEEKGEGFENGKNGS